MKNLALPIIAFFASGCIAQEVDLDSLVLADGFSITVYAELDGPRQMAVGTDGVVYVGGAAVPRAAESIATSRDRGMRPAFITNNASRTPDTVADHLTTRPADGRDPDGPGRG